ncbi:MAG: hypothetical protein ABSH47_19140 [Bryobacteraceae bacterium]
MASAAGLSPIAGTYEPLRAVIERFVLKSGEPVLTEDGEGLFALTEGTYALEERNGRLTIQAWNGTRTLTRRVMGIESESRGRLALRVERFGKRAGVLTLIDMARPSTKQHHRQSARLEVRETFRRFLRRWYSEFHIAELTTGAVLTESLSPNFPRAFLRSGAEGWAAIAAPADPLLADQALSFGLIWLDYLRRREKKCTVRGLIVYLPAGHERTTCLRLRFLNGEAACYRAWAYTADGVDFPIDLADYGNLDTRVEPCRGMPAPPVKAFDHSHPELWLEAQVRTSLRKIDPALLPEPVYGQVPAFAATAHGLIDLLGVDASGRASVIELKASEDIHLPLQALDYWMRVRWHLERGDFASAGYFPGVELRPEPPRLLLVAPALLFHPTNEVILRYFSPEVGVERIGVGIEWQKSLRVLFRAPSPCR